MTTSQLVPVVPGTIGNVHCLTVDGRALHGVLGVRRDFTSWMKGRIAKYGFLDGQDFEVFTKTGENSEGGRPSQEYSCALDMSKELCMVENNEKGRIARRYFIECERQLLTTQPAPALDTDSRLSKRSDPERKELHALVNTWVGCAPLHYAAVNAIINAYIGVKSVDEMTVAQVKRAIEFARGKIAEAMAIKETALPLPPAPDPKSLARDEWRKRFNEFYPVQQAASDPRLALYKATQELMLHNSDHTSIERVSLESLGHLLEIQVYLNAAVTCAQITAARVTE